MKKKNRGVITVEAALVMPVILGTLFLLYSLAMIQYNNIVARAEAMRVANRVAMNWNLIGGTDGGILREDLEPVVYFGESVEEGEASRSGADAITDACYTEHDPYRLFGELFQVGNVAAASTKKANIESYLNLQMGNVAAANSGITMTSTSSVASDAGYHIFNRYVSVTIDNVYQSPMLQILANMGFSVEDTYSVTAKAKLTEPAEFVRNISFVEEMLRELTED